MDLPMYVTKLSYVLLHKPETRARIFSYPKADMNPSPRRWRPRRDAKQNPLAHQRRRPRRPTGLELGTQDGAHVHQPRPRRVAEELLHGHGAPVPADGALEPGVRGDVLPATGAAAGWCDAQGG